MKPETLLKIENELKRARTKFPSNAHLLAALTEETGEVAKALLENQPRNTVKEAIQTAVVAIRIAEEGDSDFPKNPSQSAQSADSEK